jgi:hypothetical protein
MDLLVWCAPTETKASLSESHANKALKRLERFLMCLE